MSLDRAGGPRRNRHVAPLATGLVLIVVASACLFAGHGHLPTIEDGGQGSVHPHPEHGSTRSACSVCSIAHSASVAVSPPGTPVREDRSIGPRRPLALPRAGEPLTDERSPRAPPRPQIG